MIDLDDHHVWIIEQLKQLAIALGEDSISEQRLEIYAAALEEEQEVFILEEAFCQLRHRARRFPLLPEIIDAIGIEYQLWDEPDDDARASHREELWRTLVWYREKERKA